MILMKIMMLVIMLISSITMILAMLFSKKSNYDREKMSPFECGFDPFSKARLPFSLQFFLITIIFLIFDVEIALILPMIMTINTSSLMMWVSTSVIFLFILLIGVYYEWYNGALNWTM